jgi:hypothetical protein
VGALCCIYQYLEEINNSLPILCLFILCFHLLCRSWETEREMSSPLATYFITKATARCHSPWFKTLVRTRLSSSFEAYFHVGALCETLKLVDDMEWFRECKRESYLILRIPRRPCLGLRFVATQYGSWTLAPWPWYRNSTVQFILTILLSYAVMKIAAAAERLTWFSWSVAENPLIIGSKQNRSYLSENRFLF